jgi:hypothetical protein
MSFERDGGLADQEATPPALPHTSVEAVEEPYDRLGRRAVRAIWSDAHAQVTTAPPCVESGRSPRRE